MKPTRYIQLSLLVVFILSITSCRKYLDKVPLDSINTSNFFKTPDDAINAINAAYQPMQRPKLYNLRMWTSDIMAGNSVVGAGGGTDGIETVEEANFTTDPGNPGVLDLWRGPWPGILSCNLVLQNVPGIKMDEALRNRILGEAKFLRANYYFILVRYFGDVPLITTPQSPKDTNYYPSRVDKKLVYNLIIQDLKDAIDLLPRRETYTGSDVGRASKGSAVGLLAKVYLTLGQYADVIPLCQQVTQLGYTLDANYSDNFDPAHKNGPESLFEVQYSGQTNYGFFDDLNQASWTSTFMGPRNTTFVGGAYGWNQPTQEFVDSYEPGDKRKDQTILYQGGPDFYGNVYSSTYSTTGYNVRKFLVPTSKSPQYNTSNEDFPVLRYADVLLMEAEALNATGKTAEAQLPSTDPNATLNKVRARAGLPDVTGLSQADLKEKILHERRMELAFEGDRWFDLVRVDNGQYGLNFLHSIGKTNATAKNLLLPIPQVEIDANPNLKQNPGY
ncbi:MAG TPA: RagB/SusD family nutrient uptake outer membrane protein [Hanamia sp.]|nr:RagB/SusD family nutrient uptake outer membrane protein [Hanamia sp.]